jgi:hypothetical protein
MDLRIYAQVCSGKRVTVPAPVNAPKIVSLWSFLQFERIRLNLGLYHSNGAIAVCHETVTMLPT